MVSQEPMRPEAIAAERIKFYRDRYVKADGTVGLSRPELAAELAKYGQTFSNPSVSLRRIEEGTARIRLDDLVTFAAALGVPLLALLVPAKPWTGVKLSAEEAVGRDHYRDFVCGLQPWNLSDEPRLRAAALEHIDGLVPMRTREDLRAAAGALADRRRAEFEQELDDIDPRYRVEVEYLDKQELQQWRVKSGNHHKDMEDGDA